MNNWTFTPTGKTDDRQIRVPFFEDAREEIARFYSTTKRIETIKEEIIAEVGKLGGGGVQFQEGYFGDKPRRYGYVIEFNLNGHPAKMVAAGLPMRSETPKKRDQVCAQALSNIREWLSTANGARVFSPGSNPLVQFLLVDGQRTLTEALFEGNQLRLPQPAKKTDAIGGEVVDG